ncbi:lysostaphin resistance A-like protein [Halobaculum sp. MBLA0147]|uniref:CPBP family intramembrane glutamic endopeptidase n=1 Tax=Halobaculum sp. MBLA0147 TaxID=3079934 RepID=UPI00352624AA
MTETSHGHTTADGQSSESGLLRTLGVGLGLWVLGVGGFFGAGVGVRVAAIVGLGVEYGQSPPWVTAAGQGLAAVAMLAVGGGYAVRYHDGLWGDRDLGEHARVIGGGVLVAAVAYTTFQVGVAVAGVTLPQNVIGSTQGTWVYVALLAYTVVGAPVVEEVLFRGAIQRRLRVSLGRWPAVALASVPFLSVHAGTYVGGSTLGLGLAVALLFGVSLLLGYVYDRTNALVVPVLVHAGYNTFALTTGLLGVWPA